MLSVIGHIAFYMTLGLGVLLTSLGLFGTWLILVASVIYAAATGFTDVTPGVLGILALIAVVLEGLEFLLAVKLAEKMGTGKGASWAALVGAFLGGIWGTFIVPVLGSLIGALAGAFLGASLWEVLQGRSARIAWKSGRGALFGRGGALVIKTIGAVVMAIIVVTA